MRFRQFAAVAPLILGLAFATAVAAQETPAAPPASPAADSADAMPEKQERHKIKKHTVPVTPSAWMWGFSVGAGSAQQTLDFHRSSREIGTGGNFRVGYAARPTVIVAVEMSQWESSPDSSVWTFRGVMPSVRIHPFSASPAKGFWFRLAGGWGQMRSKFEVPTTRYVSATNTFVPDTLHLNVNDDGFAAAIAVGYEWRWGKRLGIGPQGEYTYVNTGVGRRADFSNATVNINWYW